MRYPLLVRAFSASALVLKDVSLPLIQITPFGSITEVTYVDSNENGSHLYSRRNLELYQSSKLLLAFGPSPAVVQTASFKSYMELITAHNLLDALLPISGIEKAGNTSERLAFLES